MVMGSARGYDTLLGLYWSSISVHCVKVISVYSIVASAPEEVNGSRLLVLLCLWPISGLSLL